MTASGTEIIPADDVVATPPADHAPAPRAASLVSITAGADIPGTTAGTEFSSMSSVADAFAKRLQSLRRVTGGDGEQHTVASLHIESPEAQRLSAGDSSDNWAKIQAATAPKALVAAGVCTPAVSFYDVDGVGVVDRPVRDSLPGFQAERGGVRFMSAPVLSTYTADNDNASAIGIWKGSDGTMSAPVGATQKPSLVVACGTETTVYVDAVTCSLVFNNLHTRAHPEMIERHNDLALVAHARIAEENILGKIKAAGTAKTGVQIGSATEKVGAARDFLVQVDRAAARYRYVHRTGAAERLRLIAPLWLKDALRADLTLQMPGENTLGVAPGAIDDFFEVRGINVTWTLESLVAFPAESGGNLGVFPATAEWDLFAEGTFLFVDGGTLDLGIIRDSALVATNDYKQFVETFEGVAKVGADSWHITSTVLISGAAAALIDTTT